MGADFYFYGRRKSAGIELAPLIPILALACIGSCIFQYWSMNYV
jgi:hypothetical protein